MERAKKPAALSSTPGPGPSAQVTISHGNTRVSAVLPTGDSIEVLLHGATVTSWKDSSGNEKLWLSTAAKMDGSKPVRGGIPLVFPVFGQSKDHPPTSKLPQHGFARNSRWEFLGKGGEEEGGSVKLDFGLSSGNLGQSWKDMWGYNFGLVYSVTLSPGKLSTSLVVSNEGEESFECQVLMHTYLRIEDISSTQVTGLESSSFIDKVDGATLKTQSGPISIAGETDCVYNPTTDPSKPIQVVENGKPTFTLVRENLADVVVWNPWSEKAAGMGDFEPKDGWKNMICVEAGSVKGWTKLEKGDVFEGAQTISV